MEIRVCIGSACHLKGAYQVIEGMKAVIIEEKASDKVQLRSSFCLGACGEGVSVAVDDVLYSLGPDEAIDFLKKQIRAEV